MAAILSRTQCVNTIVVMQLKPFRYIKMRDCGTGGDMYGDRHSKANYNVIQAIIDQVSSRLVVNRVRAFGMNPEIWGSRPSQFETFSLAKILERFTRTSFRESRTNAVSHAQLTLEMLITL